MKSKELIQREISELKDLLVEKKKALNDFKLGFIGSKTRNVREGRVIKRDVARILTAINSK
jgi:ribosomal protein L29